MEKLSFYTFMILPILGWATLQKVKYNNEMINILKTLETKAPPHEGVTVLSISLHITDIYAFSEQDMTFNMKYHFRLKWLEPDLKFDPNPTFISVGNDDNNISWVKVNYSANHANYDSTQLDGGNSSVLDFHGWILDGHIWFPDIFIVNQIPIDFHLLNHDNGIVKIYPDGHVLLQKLVTSSMRCQMFLHEFPFDTQRCSVLFESYNYGHDELIIKWNQVVEHQVGAVSMDNLFLDDFEITGKIR